jgi:catechol 2,3-dioxygenase-like lactoylglutathione lyase family enzyme
MMVAPALQRIHQVSIRISDIERAVRFYRDTLGLTLLFQAPPQLAFFDCGGVRLMLAPAEPEFDHQGTVLYFAVEDMVAKLPDREVWLADFLDSEGNVLALMSEPTL